MAQGGYNETPKLPKRSCEETSHWHHFARNLIVLLIIAAATATIWLAVGPGVSKKARHRALFNSLRQCIASLNLYMADNDDKYALDWRSMGYARPAEKLPSCDNFKGLKVSSVKVGRVLLLSECTPCTELRISNFAKKYSNETWTVLHQKPVPFNIPSNWNRKQDPSLSREFPEIKTQKGVWALTVYNGKVTECFAL